MNILFCNIGWMECYNGITDNDKITGGGYYVDKTGSGSEIYNYSEYNSYYYGFVATSTINIQRLGASPDADHVTNVLVVWVSKQPKGGIRIIGWYNNAKVYKEYQNAKVDSKRYLNNDPYNIEAKVEDCVLLPIEERTFQIHRATKDIPGIGQDNLWYADKKNNKLIVKKVIDYISNYNRKGITEIQLIRLLIKLSGYSDFLILLKPEYNEKLWGVYYTNFKVIVLYTHNDVNELYDNETIIKHALHELAHHIQYYHTPNYRVVKTQHDKVFKKILKDLLDEYKIYTNPNYKTISLKECKEFFNSLSVS